MKLILIARSSSDRGRVSDLELQRRNRVESNEKTFLTLIFATPINTPDTHFDADEPLSFTRWNAFMEMFLTAVQLQRSGQRVSIRGRPRFSAPLDLQLADDSKFPPQLPFFFCIRYVFYGNAKRMPRARTTENGVSRVYLR